MICKSTMCPLNSEERREREREREKEREEEGKIWRLGGSEVQDIRFGFDMEGLPLSIRR